MKKILSEKQIVKNGVGFCIDGVLKTSFIEKDIGKHKHEMEIYFSYENYAVCKKCKMHDWSCPTLMGFIKKYPNAPVIDLVSESKSDDFLRIFKKKNPSIKIINCF